MGSFITRRSLQSLISLAGLVVAVFFLARLTGDPTNLYLPIDASVEARQEFRAKYGFDDPLIVQFGRFLADLGAGDLGESIRKSRPALEVVLEAMPTTLKLAGITMGLALALAIVIGSLAAYRPGGAFDRIASVISLLGASAPDFWLAISGIKPVAGSITFEGKRIDGLPAHQTVREGIAHVLERRRLFPFLTVEDNVLLGAHNPRARAQRDETLARVEVLFPLLKARRSQLATTLSGGEQQMVAIARGLMARPKLLMVDEPFLGLAPMVVEEIGTLMKRVRDEQGISVVLIEQNVELALSLADRGFILESGRTIMHGPSAQLLGSAEVKRIFLGDFAY